MNGVDVSGSLARVHERVNTSETDTALALHAPEGVNGADKEGADGDGKLDGVDLHLD